MARPPVSQPRDAPARQGRPRVTSRAELTHLALRLFSERGFEETTVDDIAAAAGIGRRTFFRYFPSKNDVVWGDFDAQLDRMRATLRSYPSDLSLMDALRHAVVDFNRFPPEESEWHRRRMALILRVPALQAHSTLRYAAWRQVVAEYAARRLEVAEDDLLPQTLAYTMLGVAVASYEQWLAHPDADLGALLDTAVRLVASGFTGLPGSGGQGGAVRRG